MRPLSDHRLALILREQGHDVVVPAARKKGRKSEESRHQGAVIRWWAYKCRELKVPEILLFAVPNGGWRDEVGAAILKREGQRNGVSDLFLALPFNGKAGLFLEMKVPVGGVVSDEQEAFIEAVKKQGYSACVCRGYDEAVKTIEKYLAGIL